MDVLKLQPGQRCVVEVKDGKRIEITSFDSPHSVRVRSLDGYLAIEPESTNTIWVIASA